MLCKVFGTNQLNSEVVFVFDFLSSVRSTISLAHRHPVPSSGLRRADALSVQSVVQPPLELPGDTIFISYRNSSQKHYNETQPDADIVQPQQQRRCTVVNAYRFLTHNKNESILRHRSHRAAFSETRYRVIIFIRPLSFVLS